MAPSSHGRDAKWVKQIYIGRSTRPYERKRFFWILSLRSVDYSHVVGSISQVINNQARKRGEEEIRLCYEEGRLLIKYHDHDEIIEDRQIIAIVDSYPYSEMLRVIVRRSQYLQ